MGKETDRHPLADPFDICFRLSVFKAWRWSMPAKLAEGMESSQTKEANDQDAKKDQRGNQYALPERSHLNPATPIRIPQ
jgi:hypothetical protein